MKKQNIETVDIWSSVYMTCLDGCLEVVGQIEGKTVYRSIIRRKLYFLTDSRYGEDYYL